MSSAILEPGVETQTGQATTTRNEFMSDPQTVYTPSVRTKNHVVDPAEDFDSPPRKPLKINPVKATFNIVLAFGLIGALIAGYIIGLRLFDLGITSVGLYGTVLLSEYLVQLACAVLNRFDIDRIVNGARRKSVQEATDCEKGEKSKTSSSPLLLNPGAEVSVAVVGYREDEQAWRQCLRSLQTQTLHPKCVVGVVDGNEEPDLDMAKAFVDEFKSHKAPIIHLPILLSELHQKTYLDNVPPDTRSYLVTFWHYLVGRYRPGHEVALSLARQAVVEQCCDWDNQWNISSLKAVCFSQPHGHKRTAMFTAFAMNLYVMRTRDAIFTTDSDTLVRENGIDEMLTLLRSAPQIGGVTADVKIWNRRESLLARMCAARYWFAFNIERACQSLWRCVSCLSGPMSMYRASDLDTILGPWNLQMFGGKATTFGDDRHLTNQLLAHGLRTRYTHRTWCDSESPTVFVRWVAQQTRWSKSFYREAFWFPASFVYQAPWMLVEITIQTLYPFILIATVFHFLFDTSSPNNWRPVIWLGTMFAVALFKSILAVIISWDPWLLLFSLYGFIYFFGLLPSKVWALFTMNQTAWGTSARSSSERNRGQTFMQRSFQVIHLVIWYIAIFVGLGFFLQRILRNPLYFLIGAIALLPCILLYWQPSLPKFPRLISKRKKAPDSSPAIQVDEDMLPRKPEPALGSPGDSSPTMITRDFGSTVENTPALLHDSRDVSDDEIRPMVTTHQ
jgi:hyaluronan synthase